MILTYINEINYEFKLLNLVSKAIQTVLEF